MGCPSLLLKFCMRLLFATLCSKFILGLELFKSFSSHRDGTIWQKTLTLMCSVASSFRVYVAYIKKSFNIHGVLLISSSKNVLNNISLPCIMCLQHKFVSYACITYSSIIAYIPRLPAHASAVHAHILTHPCQFPSLPCMPKSPALYQFRESPSIKR